MVVPSRTGLGDLLEPEADPRTGSVSIFPLNDASRCGISHEAIYQALSMFRAGER